MKTILMMLALTPALYAQEASIFRTFSVVPLVGPGATVTIQNDGPMDQYIRVSLSESVWQHRFPARSAQVLTFERECQRPPGEPRNCLVTTELEYALVQAQTEEYRAWSVMDGTTFAAINLNTFVRAVYVKPETGLAIVNPWGQTSRLTFARYIDGVERLPQTRLTLAPGSITVGFYRDLAGPVPPEGVMVLMLSELQLAVGAAECVERCVSIPVSAIGVREIMNGLNPK